MYRESLQWIIEFSVKRGKQPEFEKLVGEMADMVRRSEPGTRKYEWFYNARDNKCVVVESYDSSISGIAHAKGEAVAKLFPQILKVAKVTGFKVCGNPTDKLIEELADVHPTIYPFIGGFSR